MKVIHRTFNKNIKLITFSIVKDLLEYTNKFPMHKIKGLITAIKENEEASIMILPFNKRIEEYQKIIRRINQVYDKVFVQPHVNFIAQLSLLNKTTFEELRPFKNKPECFLTIMDIFSEVQKYWKSANLQIKTYSDEGFKAIFQQSLQIKKVNDLLYDQLAVHELKESQLIQGSKKYSKSHKNFIQAMQSYKMAFQDVKLIYNNEEKIKRYKACSSFFNAAVSDLQQINRNIQFLNSSREQLKSILESFKKKSIQFIRIVGQQVLKIPLNIIKSTMRSNKELINLLNQKCRALKQKASKSLFEKFRLPFPNPEYFNCQLGGNELEVYPSFVVNLKEMKAEHFGKSKKFLIEYYVSTREDIRQRLEVNEKMKNYFSNLLGLFERIFSSEQKELKELINQKYIHLIQSHFSESAKLISSQSTKLNSSQSTKLNSSDLGEQMISQSLGVTGSQLREQEAKEIIENKSMSMISEFKISQSIETVFFFLDEQKELSKNMNKFYSQHFKLLLTELDEQNKNLILFKEQFKSRFYSLFVGKKEFKKDLETLKSGEIENLTLNEDEVSDIKQQVLKKTNFILMLIKGFNDKFKISANKIKTYIESFLDDYIKHFSYQKDLYSKLQLKLENFMSMLIQIRLKQTSNSSDKYFWLDQSSIYKAIVKEILKVKFDSQIQKVNQFKKLKKPTQDFEQKEAKLNSPIRSNSQQKESQSFQLPFSKNYEKFIQQNTIFEQGQRYVSNFKCGLCDNIIVSGRLYVTTHRLFFHSRFNSSNIFFGDTKLEIPRLDIKKIEKKYNAIIFDNSISITTLNGEIFFTSLVSRDQAYDLICKTFDINNDEFVFVSDEFVQEIQQQNQDFNLDIEQEDDLSDNQLEARVKIIDEMIQCDEKSDEKAFKVSYQNLMNQTLKFPALDAVKIFKIFQSGQQISCKNKTYQSFLHYFRGYLHKNQKLNIDQWEPNILDYLNPSNIKKGTPLKFSRRIEANVPAPQTSIPFMPKFIESCQNHQLYFYSKDKYVIISNVKNSKAPYTDCFYLRYKKVVVKTDENTVNIHYSVKIIFVKKTMVQSMIESRALKESQQNLNSLVDQMRKYLQNLQKTIKKQLSKGKTQKEALQNDEDLTNDLNLQQGSQSFLGQKVALENKLGLCSKQKNVFQWGLMISLLLNIFLLLIIFTGSEQDGKTT